MKTLYKYVVPERIDILQNGLIRFTQPMYFNDPFELYPSIKNFTDDSGRTELCEMLIKHMEDNPDEVEKNYYEELEKIQQHVPIS